MSTEALIDALYVVILLLASVLAIYIFNTLSLKRQTVLNEDEVKKLEKTMEELYKEIRELKEEITSLRRELAGEP